MAHFENRKFIVGGKPVLVLSGEIHYFRLLRKDWEDRIRKAKTAGCNAVASYIPWLYHEETEGEIDLIGHHSPEHDLGAFIDACRSHGLWFIARPGPFTMGEIKNEGIPDWIRNKCPNAVPVTWDGKRATSKNLNYLDPDFLGQAKRWYQAIGKILGPRMEPSGGNVIAVQLDNEIGMLQCWTEEADLSEDTLCQFAEWVQKHFDPVQIRRRYPFDMADPFARSAALRDGKFATARMFHADYTEFNRVRYSKYVEQLRNYAEEAGMRDVPFVINIHGSGGGRATTFPIGVSQTFEAYTQRSGYWGSSDHYLGELTRQNIQDLYFLNAFMASVNRPEQPLSSIEFEAGTGDYGETGAVRQSGAATDFKARLSVVQGNRLLNHYLLAGGHNPILLHSKQDGNSRVGTTGGRHGFAAPIGPEGDLDPVYFALAETNHSLSSVADLLVNMEEELDRVSLGFLPDYYSTDVKRAGPMQELAGKLEQARGPLEGMVRSMMEIGLSFSAVNLQKEVPATTKAIALAASVCLHREVQERLIQFVEQGGNLLLYGRIPAEDLEGNPCTKLTDRLQLNVEPLVNGSGDYFPSLEGLTWAKASPEVRIYQAEPFTSLRGKCFLRLLQTRLSVGEMIPLGLGKVVLVTAELPMHEPLWRQMFEQIGVKPALKHDYSWGGIAVHRMKSVEGGCFLSLMNLDHEEKEFHVWSNGIKLMENRIFLAGKMSKLLPLGVNLEGIHILEASTEIARRTQGQLAFRQTLSPEMVRIRGRVRVARGDAEVKILEADTLVQISPGRGMVWIEKG